MSDIVKHLNPDMCPRVEVLDHGFVRLVDYMGNDLSVVRAARVSYDADWRTGEEADKDAKLIRYLLRNRHTSPFESVTFTFEMKAPIFIMRQWWRHRTWDDPTKLDGDAGLAYQKFWAYNEVSARYTELPEEFYIPLVENITTQSTSNKQMRTKEVHLKAEEIRNSIFAQCTNSFDMYKHLLEMGTPRELARCVLPVNTYTRYFGTVSLHNLLGFLVSRIHKHAQYEIQVYGHAMIDLIRPIVPVTLQYWEEILNDAGKSSAQS